MHAAMYFHTVRYVRPSQLCWLLWYRTSPTFISSPTTVSQARVGNLQTPRVPFLKTQSSLQGSKFTFLNHSVDFANGIEWLDPTLPKLWHYCLQYMHFLHQPSMTPASARAWIMRWIEDSSDPSSEGWDPFPTSLRLVNWFKLWWQYGLETEEQTALSSAYAQARQLRKTVEFHLQANHLFENLKSLFWAGLTFRGQEAEGWQRWSARHLVKQLHEQILPDGGHYERSPMYHAHILEGCLDLLNIKAAWAQQHPALASLLSEKTEAMLSWLETMTHPDGEIALLNDAAFNMAPVPSQLFTYGHQLGLKWPAPRCVSYLDHSGYLIIREQEHYLVLDIGPIGPDHQPGHSHCDLFSFEWSLGSQRVITDSGTYSYQEDPSMRSYARSTAAHNTLSIDGAEQSEMWQAFRVARRAYPETHCVEYTENGTVRVVSSHNGFSWLRGRPRHQRTFRFSGGQLMLLDTVRGSGIHEINAHVHFHPSMTIQPQGDQSFNIHLAHHKIGCLRYENWQQATLDRSWYCPEFGKRKRRPALQFHSHTSLPFQGCINICLDRT
jgi:uncharacterized heparinase superfamily protein